MKKKYIIFTIVSILILSLGVSLAYWTARIQGEGTPMTFRAADLRIVFTDTATIEANAIEPGWKQSKTFTVKNESDSEYKYNIVMKDLLNTFVTEGFLQYKITSDSGYNTSGYLDIPKSSTPTDTTLAFSISIAGGATQEYTIEFIYKTTEEDQTPDMGKKLSGMLAIKEGTIDPTDPSLLRNKILADHTTRPGARPNLNSDVFTDDNTGTLYTASGNQTEDGSTVYYFAGNALDNWVYFADLYWRIIRINEDGSVRLLYVGPDKNTEKGYIDDNSIVYNSTDSDPMYVGYMYGDSGSLENNRNNTTSSTVKGVIDAWYNNTIKANYNDFVSRTAIYCNDRANEGYSTSAAFYYAAYKRLEDAKAPSYKCGNNASGSLYTGTNGASAADKFTASTSTGNGKLTNPVALITADEVAYAGGKYGTNAPAYYYYNAAGGSVTKTARWLTMSPAVWDGVHLHVFYVRGSNNPGYFIYDGVNITYGVRPVLSLKSCVLTSSGNGTSENPYKVEINSTCSSAEN